MRVLMAVVVGLAAQVGCGDSFFPTNTCNDDGTEKACPAGQSDQCSTCTDDTGGTHRYHCTCVARPATPGTSSCPTGTSRCGDTCVDLQSSSFDCGACGHICGAGTNCKGGACGPP